MSTDLFDQEAITPPLSTPNWNDADDGSLIQACLAGEQEAWQTLIQRYSRLIYAIPLRFGVPQALAEEIFQETCLILLEKLDTLQNSERLSSWLMTVTRRLCIQHWRQNDKLPNSIDVSDVEISAEGSIEAQLLQLEQQHLIQQALENLPERDQRLLHALFFEIPPRSYDEIAAELGISLGSIGPTRARSLKKLHRVYVRLAHLQT